MARKQRLFITDLPYHVIQRGNNKNPIFFSEKDYYVFLEVLREAKIKHPCFIYSYCLMPNHFHLLIKPKEKDNISLLMKLLGGKYVRYVNKIYKRTGTLWEGRFKCSLIEEELYFLSCLRYIEMNPLRAGIINSPELYRWSSYTARAFGEKSPVLDLDPWYNSLGFSAQERQIAYRQFFKISMPESTCEWIREMTNRGGPLGSTSFIEQMQKITGKAFVLRQRGRPKTIEK